MKILAIAVSASIGVALAPASATPAPAPIALAATKLADGDAQILAHQHAINVSEIAMGKLAQKNGSGALKGYAAALIKDHNSLDKDVVGFAQKHGGTALPDDKSQSKGDRKDMAAAVSHLATLKDNEFDREFLTMMVAGHAAELTAIDTAIGTADDADLLALLKTIKPVLQSHADQARDLQNTDVKAHVTPPMR